MRPPAQFTAGLVAIKSQDKLKPPIQIRKGEFNTYPSLFKANPMHALVCSIGLLLACHHPIHPLRGLLPIHSASLTTSESERLNNYLEARLEEELLRGYNINSLFLSTLP